jgi:hypothetical protein
MSCAVCLLRSIHSTTPRPDCHGDRCDGRRLHLVRDHFFVAKKPPAHDFACGRFAETAQRHKNTHTQWPTPITNRRAPMIGRLLVLLATPHRLNRVLVSRTLASMKMNSNAAELRTERTLLIHCLYLPAIFSSPLFLTRAMPVPFRWLP